MASCLELMLVSIFASGVNPDAYKEFVEYNVDHLRPENNKIGITYVNTITSAVSYIALVVLILILVAFAILVLVFVTLRYISYITGIIIVIVAAALISIYYMIALVYIKNSYVELQHGFQDSLVDTTIYVGNSAFRDGIYIGLCE